MWNASGINSSINLWQCLSWSALPRTTGEEQCAPGWSTVPPWIYHPMPIWWLREDTVPTVHPLKTRERMDFDKETWFYGNVTANFLALALFSDASDWFVRHRSTLFKRSDHYHMSFAIVSDLDQMKESFGLNARKKANSISFFLFVRSFARSLVHFG